MPNPPNLVDGMAMIGFVLLFFIIVAVFPLSNIIGFIMLVAVFVFEVVSGRRSKE